MDALLGLLFFIAFVALIVGLINPKWAIRWGQSFSRKKVLLTYGIPALAFIVISIIFYPQHIDTKDTASESTTSTTMKKETKPIKLSATTASTTTKKETKAPRPTTTTTTTQYPKIDISSYPEGSPERAFAEFLYAWQQKDWNRMVKFTQKTWQSNQQDPAKYLFNAFGFKNLLGAEITKKETIGEANIKIEAIIYYALGPEIEKKKGTANIICETAPDTPDPNGEWGVNPISTLGF